MKAKYTKGRKVRIISLKDEHLKSKHPYIEEYVSQTGVIVESHWYAVNESYRPSGERPHLTGHYIYDVCLDRDRKIVRAIPEDALEPLVQ